MSWFIKLLVSLSISTSLVTGTTPASKQAPSSSRLVVAAEIAEGGRVHRYTQPMQIETVLYYLRGLTPGGRAAEDPERYAGPLYTVTLFGPGGERQVYRQKSDRWISKNSHPWRRIPEQKARMLPQLLAILQKEGGEDVILP